MKRSAGRLRWPARPLLLSALALAAAGCGSGAAHAGAATDGSMGAVQTLSGAFTVPQSLGTLRGANLFHSFGRFSIASGESATFTTFDPGLRNVIARVTGGEASLLQGPLVLVAGGGARPDFFLVNPSGITVAAGASFDVPAALHLSTAAQMRFADGSAWATGSTVPSTLTIAAPESFGFLGTRAAAPIQVAGAGLASGAGKALTLSAGSIVLADASLAAAQAPLAITATGADAMLVPVAGTAAPPAGAAGAGGTLQLRNAQVNSAGGGSIQLQAGGDIVMSEASSVFASGSGQAIRLRSGGLRLDGSWIQIFSGQEGAPGLIDVATNGAIELTGGAEITAVSFVAAARPQAVVVSGATLRLDDSLIGSSGLGDRDAGGLSVSTSGELLLRGASRIFSATGGRGPAGTVAVRAGSLRMVGLDNLSADAIFDAATGITSQSEGFATGQSGAIDLQVSGAIELTRQAIISASTQAQGNAGTVTVRGASLLLDGAGLPGLKGIFSNSNGSLLDAGRVDVRVSGDVAIRRGSGIGADSNFGSGGSVRVDAATMTLDGSGGSAGVLTGISSRALTQTALDAGPLAVNVSGALAIRGGAAIGSETASAFGRGGDVVVRAGTLALDGTGVAGRTGIFAGALPASSGRVGTVDVGVSGLLSLAGGASLSIANESQRVPVQAFAPSLLRVEAGRVESAGGEISASSVGVVAASGIRVASHGTLVLDASAVRTTAVDGNGGNIELDSAGTIALRDTRITTSVSGKTNGNGGDIRISAPALVMSSSAVQANTTAPLARGGTVVVAVDALVPDGSHVFVGGSRILETAAGVPGANIIQAAAPDGVGGTLNLAVPQLDLSGQLAGVHAAWIDFGGLALDACLRNERSTFALAGRGALPAQAAQVLRFAAEAANPAPARR